MRKDITGIIICGGKSSRMLTNKALLRLGKLTVFEIIAQKLKDIFNHLVIVANDISNFAFLNLPIVQDAFVNRGAFGGIHATLK